MKIWKVFPSPKELKFKARHIELQDLENENRIWTSMAYITGPTHDKCYIQVSEDYNQVIAILNAPCKLDSKLSMQHSKQGDGN